MSPYLLWRNPSFTIFEESQKIQFVVVRGAILATSTSFLRAKEISTAKMCLHLTPRNLWSGHEQTHPKSVEQTSYSPPPFWDFTTYFASLILFIAPSMLAIANPCCCRFIAVMPFMSTVLSIVT